MTIVIVANLDGRTYDEVMVHGGCVHACACIATSCVQDICVATSLGRGSGGISRVMCTRIPPVCIADTISPAHTHTHTHTPISLCISRPLRCRAMSYICSSTAQHIQLQHHDSSRSPVGRGRAHDAIRFDLNFIKKIECATYCRRPFLHVYIHSSLVLCACSCLSGTHQHNTHRKLC